MLSLPVQCFRAIGSVDKVEEHEALRDKSSDRHLHPALAIEDQEACQQQLAQHLD
jgi:hypothetical protein